MAIRVGTSAQFLGAFFLIAISAVAIGASTEEDVASAPTEEELAVIAYRKSLQSCEVVVRSVTWRRKQGQLAKESETIYRLVCDGEKLRTDRDILRIVNDVRTPVGRQWAAKTRDFVFRRTFDTKDESREVAPELFHILDANVWRDAKWSVIDPRLLGLSPNALQVLHSDTFDSFIGFSQKRARQRCQSVTEAGKQLLLIEFDAPPSKARMKIDRERGPSLVFGEIVSGDSLASVDIRIEQFGDVWFPRELRVENRVRENVVMRNEITTLNATFGGAVPSETFGFPGLKVAPGAIIVEIPPNPNGSRVWNGRELVPFRLP